AVSDTGAIHPFPFLEREDRLGDEAAVPLLDRIVGRGKTPVRLGEPLIAMQRAGLERGEVHVGRRRPLVTEQRLDVAYRTGDLRQDRVAVLPVVDREAYDVRERHRAEVAQYCEPAAERTRPDRR